MNGATVKVYSLAKDGSKQLSAHFKVREFACSDGSDAVFISPELVEILKRSGCISAGPCTSIRRIVPPQRTRPWAVRRRASTCTAWQRTSPSRV